MELFDTHCHPDFPQFDKDRDEVFQRMHVAGVTRMVAVSVELGQYERLAELAEAREGIWFSTGVHPNHVVDAEPCVEELLLRASHPKCVAIGETGLDYFRHRVSPAAQQERFRVHVEASRLCGKPLIVHMRQADEDALCLMREACAERGIMHCFSSTKDVARQALDLGFYISFSGNVTFKGNDSLRDVAAYVPLDRLLVETDAPYLAPMPYRGKRNEPAYVREVAECIARVRSMSLEDLAYQTTQNALNAFLLNEEEA
ncbi:MAG: TatD family deoxyribonuclease [Zetaproteobacteria bacterium]|nr:MAG: TatD family deoxyribonuclease [Zetaproteobacteria bacterium]